MGHKILEPVCKTKRHSNHLVEVEVTICCFPNGRVEYFAKFLRVSPSVRFQVEVAAIFKVGGKVTNRSRKATFFSYRDTVAGVAPGPVAHSGYSLPSASQIHGVDDFELSGGILQAR